MVRLVKRRQIAVKFAACDEQRGPNAGLGDHVFQWDLLGFLNRDRKSVSKQAAGLGTCNTG
jgi:hypothetical protein